MITNVMEEMKDGLIILIRMKELKQEWVKHRDCVIPFVLHSMKGIIFNCIISTYL